ncbi:hypothetical protein FNJ84_05205 [Paracoccus sp. M683]|uniref:hypothetical protein n=1 Tax=Paracoccus sp. M683 TaxID=2594268 RepID=UPI00117C3FF9|nr:hypothetical protein [Paracoccus sp. M683]TRW98187.1 hypothetical protein FNJ84_05205 [Paracoccus sp. M683]
MQNLIALALDDRRLLRPAFVQEQGFSSLIFPDYIDRDDFLRLAAQARAAGSTAITIHHAEFGAGEQVETAADPEAAWESLFDHSHEDIIVSFAPAPLLLWLPAGEHFHVAFGSAAAMTGLADVVALKADFIAYVEESGLTEKGQAFLRDCLTRYMIQA